MYELLNIEVKDGKQLVSARELHRSLRVQQDFSDWIKKQLEAVDAVGKEDYEVIWYRIDDPFKKVVEFNGNTNSMVRNGNQQDYVLKLDIAKEICMVVGVSPRTNEETRRLSKKIRKYFIGCEKLAKQLTHYYDEKFEMMLQRLECAEKLIGLRCKQKFDYGRYIKNKMCIAKANKAYENVKMVLFAELGVSKWEEISYSLDVIMKIDEVLEVLKLDRQLSL